MTASKDLENAVVTENPVKKPPNVLSREVEPLATPTSASLNLESQLVSPPPYHVFSRTRKLQIVYIVSAAAIFSPLSSNIYFPALGAISKVSWHD